MIIKHHKTNLRALLNPFFFVFLELMIDNETEFWFSEKNSQYSSNWKQNLFDLALYSKQRTAEVMAKRKTPQLC